MNILRLHFAQVCEAVKEATDENGEPIFVVEEQRQRTMKGHPEDHEGDDINDGMSQHADQDAAQDPDQDADSEDGANTVSEDEDDLMNALKAGARGYVLKGVSARELVDAVRAVAKGEVYISPALASGILVEMTHTDQPNPLDDLTEREILRLVGEGLTNREIGERLHLAEKTIKHYMTNVLQKLQVRSRVEAALMAQKRSLKRDQ